MFLSCRPFVVITTLSTGLVGVEVTSVSWLGQLTVGVKSLIIVIVSFFLNFAFLFVAWPGLLILEFKSLMWGEVYILGHFVLRWHHWVGILYCYNNERPTRQKQLLFNGKTVENKCKLTKHLSSKLKFWKLLYHAIHSHSWGCAECHQPRYRLGWSDKMELALLSDWNMIYA